MARPSQPSIVESMFERLGLPVLMHYMGMRWTHIPKVGAPRDVEAICLYEQPAASIDGEGEKQMERLWIAVSRDESDGIAGPQLGDAGLRDGDEEDSPWAFQGEVRNESAHAWELLFARIRPRRYGPPTA
jgi:hypothetical protein